MKYTEFPYERPDLQALCAQLSQLAEQIKNATSAKEQLEAYWQANDIFAKTSHFYAFVNTKFTGNTADEFWRAEKDYGNESYGDFLESTIEFAKAMLESPYRQELEAELGKQQFDLYECDLVSFKPEIKDEVTAEQKLINKYQELVAKAQIEFDGKTLTLAQLEPYTNSLDRSVRKAAIDAKFNYFAEHEEEFDKIYDELVALRHTMATKLGYENYVPLAYKKLKRTDYNAKDVAGYREQVLKHLVPLATELRERQAKRLGVDHLDYYDEVLSFKSGNAKPQGDTAWIVDNASKMFNELSPETKAFFKAMRDKECLDLDARAGKASGGYCTELPLLNMPFIFTNFNGLQHDIEVLIHECGHGFQLYSSMPKPQLDYHFPTYEACEIHSMSMEFICWPWFELFFGDQTTKAKFAHLTGSIEFIPYGVAVDEFQEWVYTNHQASAKERKEAWKRIEAKYLPHRDYAGNDYLERGNFWVRQLHIFVHPFYYIDYTLAQVCALQFFNKMDADRKQGFADYLELCKAGGEFSFFKLLEIGKLTNPFTDGTIEQALTGPKKWLASVDDSKL